MMGGRTDVIIVTLPGVIVFLILLACMIVPWFFLGRFLLHKLDEYVIPRIERRYKRDDEEPS